MSSWAINLSPNKDVLSLSRNNLHERLANPQQLSIISLNPPSSANPPYRYRLDRGLNLGKQDTNCEALRSWDRCGLWMIFTLIFSSRATYSINQRSFLNEGLCGPSLKSQSIKPTHSQLTGVHVSALDLKAGGLESEWRDLSITTSILTSRSAYPILRIPTINSSRTNQ